MKNPASQYSAGAAALYEQLPENLQDVFLLVLDHLIEQAEENGRNQGYWDAREERMQ